LLDGCIDNQLAKTYTDNDGMRFEQFEIKQLGLSSAEGLVETFYDKCLRINGSKT